MRAECVAKNLVQNVVRQKVQFFTQTGGREGEMCERYRDIARQKAGQRE